LTVQRYLLSTVTKGDHPNKGLWA